MSAVRQHPEGVDAGHLPKYAVGDRVILRSFLNRAPYRSETLYVVDFQRYGTPARWVWEYFLSWRRGAERALCVLAMEDELLSSSEALYHVTKADHERALAVAS